MPSVWHQLLMLQDPKPNTDDDVDIVFGPLCCWAGWYGPCTVCLVVWEERLYEV